MKKVYVVFDGPPGPESGRFVELEDEEGRGVGGVNHVVQWSEQETKHGKLWRLGPFLLEHDRPATTQPA